MSEENIDYEKLAITRAELLKTENEAEEIKEAATQAPVTDEDLAKVIELWTGIPAAKVRAVSYTHLDVYKRQAVSPPAGPFPCTHWRIVSGIN